MPYSMKMREMSTIDSDKSRALFSEESKERGQGQGIGHERGTSRG